MRAEKDKKTSECPERDPLQVFRRVEEGDKTFNGQEVGDYVATKVHMRKKQTKSVNWQPVDNKRQASRRGHERSLVREIWKVKTVTNDDVCFAYRKSEKKSAGEVTRYTTSQEFNFQTQFANMSITSADSSVNFGRRTCSFKLCCS